MTKGQRTMHFLLWLVLGPLAALGLMLAIDWRPEKPVQDGPLPGADVQAQEASAEPGVSP